MSLSPNSILYDLGPPETGMSSLWGTGLKAYGIFEYYTVNSFILIFPYQLGVQ